LLVWGREYQELVPLAAEAGADADDGTTPFLLSFSAVRPLSRFPHPLFLTVTTHNTPTRRFQSPLQSVPSSVPFVLINNHTQVPRSKRVCLMPTLKSQLRTPFFFVLFRLPSSEKSLPFFSMADAGEFTTHLFFYFTLVSSFQSPTSSSPHNFSLFTDDRWKVKG
jgi:hypothetical protein